MQTYDQKRGPLKTVYPFWSVKFILTSVRVAFRSNSISYRLSCDGRPQCELLPRKYSSFPVTSSQFI